MNATTAARIGRLAIDEQGTVGRLAIYNDALKLALPDGTTATIWGAPKLVSKRTDAQAFAYVQNARTISNRPTADIIAEATAADATASWVAAVTWHCARLDHLATR
jgi:hypothetical protein